MGVRTTLGIIAAAMLLAAAPALAGGVVASWIQLAPGSTSATPTTENFGDAPLSLTPTILARAIVADYPAAGCPSVALDHAGTRPMARRFDGATLTSLPGTPGAANGKPGYPQFFINPAAAEGQTLPGPNGGPVATAAWTECEAIIPPGHHVATIDGVDLTLPVAHPRRILVMADTGCRMSGTWQQDCQDPASFPLRLLAGLEAAAQPDLIVQVGDWFYRDTDCLALGMESHAGCNTRTSAGYETWGDTFDSWNGDLFFPAKTLLAAAPWVMVRGNHESCGRGARGWYALLDPHPYNAARVACAKTTAYPAPGGTPAAPTPTYTADFEPTYLIPANNVTFLVHDSSFANDRAVDANMARNDEIDLTRALAAIGPDGIGIYATHRPAFGLGVRTGTNPAIEDFGNRTEQAAYLGGGSYPGSAFGNGVPGGIALFLSGHIHQLQYIAFADAARYAPTLIVGTGGDLLDPDPPGALPDGETRAFRVHQYGGATTTAGVTHAAARAHFGFAVLDAVDDADGRTTGYSARIYETGAAPGGRCAIVLGNAPGASRGIACDF